MPFPFRRYVQNFLLDQLSFHPQRGSEDRIDDLNLIRVALLDLVK